MIFCIVRKKYINQILSDDHCQFKAYEFSKNCKIIRPQRCLISKGIVYTLIIRDWTFKIIYLHDLCNGFCFLFDCHIFIGLNITCDCLIYFCQWLMVKIYIQKYGLPLAYLSQRLSLINTVTKFGLSPFLFGVL